MPLPIVNPKRLLVDTAEAATPVSQTEMALDTVAAILRILGEFAQDQEQQEAAAFTRMSEQWALHVSVAGPAPTGEVKGGKTDAARRDWAGVREFVREYCKNSSYHTRTVMTDLRQVIWVFIQNLNHSFAQDQDSDKRIKLQLGRLEALAQGGPSSTGELKREVMSTVLNLGQIVEERRKHQRARVEDLGAQVRTLGSELETVRKESEIDPLTRLFNRKAFDGFLKRSAELAHAFGHSSCLLLVDVDRFKTINDTFGHPEGDAVLRRLSDVLSRIFLRKNDFVARYGGDELAVILRETNLRDGVALGERLLKGVRAVEMEREGVRLQLSVSIGISILEEGEDPASWVYRTDQALYQAKQQGRDRMIASVGR
jgi:diguanylate cyclase (GGDEF)-like protein